MAPLITLVSTFALLRLAGVAGVDALNGWQPALRGGLAVMFVLTASAHFTARRRPGLVAMVPPGLPRPALLVTLTGGLELAGAVGLVVPSLARPAAAGLALLLIALYPANVSAARRRVDLAGHPVTPLLPRTILQVIYLGAAVAAAA